MQALLHGSSGLLMVVLFVDRPGLCPVLTHRVSAMALRGPSPEAFPMGEWALSLHLCVFLRVVSVLVWVLWCPGVVVGLCVALCVWRGAVRGSLRSHLDVRGRVVPGGGCCGCEASAITWSAGVTWRAEREEGSVARSMTLSF